MTATVVYYLYGNDTGLHCGTENVTIEYDTLDTLSRKIDVQKEQYLEEDGFIADAVIKWSSEDV